MARHRRLREIVPLPLRRGPLERWPLAAAVNERNGRVVLVRPQLKLAGTTSANATSLARNSGGTIVYTSTVDNSAVIAYPSVEKAQQALARLQANSGGAQLSLVVAQSIMQPM